MWWLNAGVAPLYLDYQLAVAIDDTVIREWNGDGTLAAALYLTRSGELPRRDWVAAQLGLGTAASTELLAGRPSTPMADRGAIVCVCHGIGENDIAAAFEAGAATVTAIGKATCAGTNCGSCRPAIARLLEASNDTEKEAAE